MSLHETGEQLPGGLDGAGVAGLEQVERNDGRGGHTVGLWDGDMVIDDAQHSVGDLARIDDQVLLPQRREIALSDVELGRHVIGLEQRSADLLGHAPPALHDATVGRQRLKLGGVDKGELAAGPVPEPAHQLYRVGLTQLAPKL
ncbi:MAG: hypothetical protein KG028_05725 [Actinobacteria bacterium]|nr:hypothetical protein [Actinomycetota bacterium]